MLIWQNKPPEVPYEYQEYPKWVAGQIVHSAEEEAAIKKQSKPKAKRTDTDE